MVKKILMEVLKNGGKKNGKNTRMRMRSLVRVIHMIRKEKNKKRLEKEKG